MKTTITFLLLLTLLIFAGFIMKDTPKEYRPSKGEELVNSTLARAAKIIKDKYNLKPCGEGAVMDPIF